MEKPKKHCSCGSYEHQIPMPIRGRVRGIDLCIANIVAALNAANIETTMSCCGHGNIWGVIMLDDGRDLIITPDHKSSTKFFNEYFDCNANGEKRKKEKK